MKKLLTLLVLLVAGFVQANAAMWLVGDAFNGWNESGNVEMTESNGIYTWSGSLTAGKYFAFFKDTQAWGSQRGPQVGNSAPSGDWESTTSSGAWKLATSGNYVIEYNYSTNQARIQLQTETPFDATQRKFAVTGAAFGGWNMPPTAAQTFTNNGDGTYTLVYEGATAGEFKLAGVGINDTFDAGWSVFNGGVLYNSSLAEGNNAMTSGNSGNMTFPVSGDVTLTISNVTATSCNLNIAVNQVIVPEKSWRIAGDFTNWGTGALSLTKNELDGSFSITVNDITENAEFKFINEYDTWFGGTTDDDTYGVHPDRCTGIDLNGNKNFKITSGHGNLTFTISSDDKLTITGWDTTPTEPELYLLGDLNTWTTSDTYKFTKNTETGKYELNSIPVPAETNFKIYDKTSNTWYGGTTDGNSYWITDAGNQNVAMNGDKNFYFKVAGTWSFVVDLDETKLSVNGTWPAHTTAYYLAGDFTDPTWKAGKIAFEAGTGAYEGKLVVADQTLAANAQFKVLAIETNPSNATETDTWYGASGDDDPFVLTEANSANAIDMTTTNSKNFQISEAGTWTFVYVPANNTIQLVGEWPHDTFTIYGEEELTGANWDATATANDMETSNYVNYTKTIEGKTLYAGKVYKYKVAVNHDANTSYPDGFGNNATLSVTESGVYNITFSYNASTHAIDAEAVKQSAVNDYVDLQGAEELFGGTAWSTMFRMSTTDGTTYTYTIEDKVLAAGGYGYKAIVNEAWSEGYVFPSTSSTNTLTISTAATYNVTITFNNSTKELTAVATPVVSWTVAGCLNDGENEVDATGFFGTKWAATATANDLTETSAGSGVWTKTYTGVPAGNYEFKVAYSHTWDAASYPSQNIKLNIPAADATVVINFYDSDHTFSVTVNGEEKIARWVIAGGVSGDGTNAGFFNTAWNASDFTNKLTESSPGVWSKTYSDVPAGTYEFKVVESGTVWYGVPPSHNNYSVTVPDDGATLQFIWDGTTCTIENTATTWTIVGGPKGSEANLNDVLFTKTWDPTQTANDLEQTSTGYWTKTFSNVHLPVGIYEFKVATNHAWDESYPTGTTNESFEVKLEGDYDVTFEFYTSNKDLYGDITLKAADVDFYLAGTTFGWGTHNATNKFSIDNGLFVLEDVDLEMGAQFKLWDGADLWIGAQSDGNYWLNDTNKDNITMLSGDGENIYLAAAAGTYTVTFNPNTFKLSVAGTFGEPVKTLAFGATGYLTFGDLRNSFSFDGKGVDVYTVTYDADGMARRHAVESKQVPVGTGVLLYHTGGAGNVEIPIIGTPAALTDNNLLVSDGTVEGATNRYCLAADSTPLGVGFYPVAASVTIPAGKAYLEINTLDPAPARIWFDGETTAIDSLNGETGVENDGTVYDLNGRRVNGTLSRGLYIKNGKKFIVK